MMQELEATRTRAGRSVIGGSWQMQPTPPHVQWAREDTKGSTRPFFTPPSAPYPCPPVVLLLLPAPFACAAASAGLVVRETVPPPRTPAILVCCIAHREPPPDPLRSSSQRRCCTLATRRLTSRTSRTARCPRPASTVPRSQSPTPRELPQIPICEAVRCACGCPVGADGLAKGKSLDGGLQSAPGERICAPRPAHWSPRCRLCQHLRCKPGHGWAFADNDFAKAYDATGPSRDHVHADGRHDAARTSIATANKWIRSAPSTAV